MLLDIVVLSKIKLDPYVAVSGAAVAELAMVSVMNNNSVGATSDSSSIPKSVIHFRDNGAEQTLIKRDAIPINMLTPLGKGVLIKSVTTRYNSIPFYQADTDCM